MTIFRTLTLALLLVSPVLASADDHATDTAVDANRDARIVPAVKEGAMYGLKLYAIRAGGRFDQPTAKFANGDTILEVDGASVATDAGSRAVYDKVIRGTADASVTIDRKGARVVLASKRL